LDDHLGLISAQSVTKTRSKMGFLFESSIWHVTKGQSDSAPERWLELIDVTWQFTPSTKPCRITLA